MESNKNRPLIAIVDDDVFVCRAMKRLVCILGMDADTFVSGQEFIGRLEGAIIRPRLRHFRRAGAGLERASGAGAPHPQPAGYSRDLYYRSRRGSDS